MKLKTFSWTLTLFLFFFNGGIALLSFTSWQSGILSIRERALGEHYFIVSSFLKDLEAVVTRGGDEEQTVRLLIFTYADYYSRQDMHLELRDNTQLLFTSLASAEHLDIPNALNNSIRSVTLRTVADRDLVEVRGSLPEPYDRYVLTCFRDISETTTGWVQTTHFLFMGGGFVSLALAICLFPLLRWIFAPLSQVAEASARLGAGQYSERIAVQGDSELAEMVQSFNHMADEIQQHIDELSQNAMQKQRFIDNLAHELRTPLTSITGYAEYLQRVALQEEERIELTSYILTAGEHLQHLADCLLDLAALRHDAIEFTRVPVPDLIRRVIEMLEPKLRHNQLHLCCENESTILYGDRYLLQSLLLNLMDNAIKASEPGSEIALTVSQEIDYTELSIRDFGKGMTSEQIQHLGEAFYRTDRARSREEGGVGLGLALCQQIVLRHQAEITFTSDLGQGTTVTVKFLHPSNISETPR